MTPNRDFKVTTIFDAEYASKGTNRHYSKAYSESQYSTVVLTVVRVMIAKYRKSGIWGYRSSLTPEPVELK